MLKGETELRQAVQTLIRHLFIDWVSPASLENNLCIDRVSGALTNAVFFVTVGKQRMLLRVYGVGCDQILDRQNELNWLSRLSHLNIGPKMLGIFGNGRFEEYLPSTTLTKDDLREPMISKQIAGRLFQLHSIVDLYPPNLNSDKLQVWQNIDQWYHALSTELIHTLKKNSDWKEQIEKDLCLVQLRNEIELCKILLSKNPSPTIFAHNDVSFVNLLPMTTREESQFFFSCIDPIWQYIENE